MLFRFDLVKVFVFEGMRPEDGFGRTLPWNCRFFANRNATMPSDSGNSRCGRRSPGSSASSHSQNERALNRSYSSTGNASQQWSSGYKDRIDDDQNNSNQSAAIEQSFDEQKPDLHRLSAKLLNNNNTRFSELDRT